MSEARRIVSRVFRQLGDTSRYCWIVLIGSAAFGSGCSTSHRTVTFSSPFPLASE